MGYADDSTLMAVVPSKSELMGQALELQLQSPLTVTSARLVSRVIICEMKLNAIETNARATPAKRPFVVNPTVVKFYLNLLNSCQICPNCGQIHTYTVFFLSYLVTFCKIMAKFKLYLINLDQI